MKNKKPTTHIGIKIGADIVASGIVGTVLGLTLDKFFDTKPILLIVCLILSLISNLWLIYKDMNNGS